MRTSSLAGAAALGCLGLASPVTPDVTRSVANPDVYAAPRGYSLVATNVAEGRASFVHSASIRHEAPFSEAWVLDNFMEPGHFNGSTFRSLLTLMRFDCDRRRSGAIVSRGYALPGATGGIVVSGPAHDDPEMEPKAPGTIGGDLIELVCGTTSD